MATCDNRSTGGWATDFTLYTVMPRYPGGVASNSFLAVLLKHETQHLADKSKLPDLRPWELEYRAKLAELWAADSVSAACRLGTFIDSQSDDPPLAHPLSQRQGAFGLTGLLGASPLGVDGAALKNARKDVLAQDTAARCGPRPSVDAISPR